MDRVATEGDGVITFEIKRDLETKDPVGLVVSPVEYSVVNGTISFLPPVEEFDAFNPNTATGLFVIISKMIYFFLFL